MFTALIILLVVMSLLLGASLAHNGIQRDTIKELKGKPGSAERAAALQGVLAAQWKTLYLGLKEKHQAYVYLTKRLERKMLRAYHAQLKRSYKEVANKLPVTDKVQAAKSINRVSIWQKLGMMNIPVARRERRHMVETLRKYNHRHEAHPA